MEPLQQVLLGSTATRPPSSSVVQSWWSHRWLQFPAEALEVRSWKNPSSCRGLEGGFSIF